MARYLSDLPLRLIDRHPYPNQGPLCPTLEVSDFMPGKCDRSSLSPRTDE